MPTLRSYRSTDHDGVVHLVQDVLAEHGFEAQVGGIEADLSSIETRYQHERAGFWVADEDGRIVGSVAVRPKEGDTCELKRLYVERRQRGTGLGQALYAHAEAFARRAGYRRIWLDSSRRFAKAHRLYEKNGFVLVARLDNDWEDDVHEKAL